MANDQVARKLATIEKYNVFRILLWFIIHALGSIQHCQQFNAIQQREAPKVNIY